MRRARVGPLVVCALFLPLLAVAAAPPALTQKLGGGVVIDWTAGRISVAAGAAADLRAPNPDVARVGAERAAGERARVRLYEAVRALPLATGTVGKAADSDPAVRPRLDVVLARARAFDVSYAADGGARVTMAVPLEAIRAALAPPAPPVLAAEAPTALVVDARQLALAPVLGIRVAGRSGAPLALPTVWHVDPVQAASDPRVGPRPRELAARAVSAGTISLDLDGKELESAARAGALIVVVVNEGAKK